MKKSHIVVLTLAIAMIGTGCNTSQDPLKPESVVRHSSSPKSDLDKWIYETYTKPYNIRVVYKREAFDDPSITNPTLPEPGQIKKVLEALHALWVEPMQKIAGEEFFSLYAPREIRLYGAPNMNSLGVEVVSTEHGGAILSIFRVNSFDPTSEQSAYRLARMATNGMAKSMIEYKPADLRALASLNFREYRDWSTQNALKGDYSDNSDGMVKHGFLSKAAQGSPLEDFAESMSILLCRTPQEIESLVEYFDYRDPKEKILAAYHGKIAFIDKYLMDNFGINRKATGNRFISRAIKAYPKSQSQKQD